MKKGINENKTISVMVKARIVTVDVAFLCNKRQQQTKKLILLHENSVKKQRRFSRRNNSP